ncbi:MAG: HK97 gp10 family phage protein [Lachnospiraceae bacterium]|nr:HK97 gp10 family phage protein [Lachnospiraceae bacterium]
MAGTGSFDCGDMRRLQQELEKLQQNTDAFLDACAKELAARLLRKVIKRTPVGQYPKGSGKMGGTLRRGWTGSQRASAQAYADSLAVSHSGGSYVIEITNPVEYAPYVEYGHRTANHKGWVRGLFMLTISEQEIQESAPRILEKKIRKFLGDVSG